MNTTAYSSEAGKREQVERMFNSIATKYDFLNHFLSAGTDILWRKKTVALLKKKAPKKILDMATGTADLAIEAAYTLHPEDITGIDISENMLLLAGEKIKKKNLGNIIRLKREDSEKTSFPGNNFDAVTVSFGVRNFENLEKGLREMHRVLKPGGTAVILEFSTPGKFPVKQLYHFYFRRILPLIGKIFSGNTQAYHYLPESVKAFPSGRDFIKIMDACGFEKTGFIPLSFGIASIYYGEK